MQLNFLVVKIVWWPAGRGKWRPFELEAGEATPQILSSVTIGKTLRCWSTSRGKQQSW